MDKWLEAFARTCFQRSADTAHDLKTPLNIAVLNLELLRIRVAKLADEGDEKIGNYIAAIDTELRRMAQIFDSFFLLSTPPKEDQPPEPIDIAPACRDLADSAGMELKLKRPLRVRIHDARMRQALTLFFDGAFHILKKAGRQVSVRETRGLVGIEIVGQPEREDFEPAKVFKFYYTDPAGKPELSLASARLIVETYGGELNATRERDKVIFQLSLPQEIDETSSDR